MAALARSWRVRQRQPAGRFRAAPTSRPATYRRSVLARGRCRARGQAAGHRPPPGPAEQPAVNRQHVLDPSFDLRRRRYGTSHGVGRLPRLAGLEGTYAVALTAPALFTALLRRDPAEPGGCIDRQAVGRHTDDRFRRGAGAGRAIAPAPSPPMGNHHAGGSRPTIECRRLPYADARAAVRYHQRSFIRMALNTVPLRVELRRGRRQEPSHSWSAKRRAMCGPLTPVAPVTKAVEVGRLAPGASLRGMGVRGCGTGVRDHPHG